MSSRLIAWPRLSLQILSATESVSIGKMSDIYRLLGVPPYDENEFVIENESQNAD
jgi:hypothetical protein